jgi:hypothetical protein
MLGKPLILCRFESIPTDGPRSGRDLKILCSSFDGTGWGQVGLRDM